MEESKGKIRRYTGEISIKNATFEIFDLICESLANKGIDIDIEPINIEHSIPNSMSCKVKMFCK